MSGREFIDTNVLIYADDTRDQRKQASAQALISRLRKEQRGVVSLQVLQEYFAAATRKLGLSSEDARRRVEVYTRFDVVTLLPPDLLAAIDLHRLHNLSFWDALVVRAAERILHHAAHRGHAARLHRRATDDQQSVRGPGVKAEGSRDAGVTRRLHDEQTTTRSEARCRAPALLEWDAGNFTRGFQEVYLPHVRQPPAPCKRHGTLDHRFVCRQLLLVSRNSPVLSPAKHGFYPAQEIRISVCENAKYRYVRTFCVLRSE